MSHGTYFKSEYFFSHKTFDNKREVEDELNLTKRTIESIRSELNRLAVMTEPAKYCGDEDPFWWVDHTFKEAWNELEELMVEKYQLETLLDAWDNCHNEEGLAIVDPNDLGEHSQCYLDGDFIASTKNPKPHELG